VLPTPAAGPDSRPDEDAGPDQTQVLLALAQTCENAGFGQQTGCLVAACELLGCRWRENYPDPWDEMFNLAHGYALAGAHESAVLAMMPASSTFTGGRLADGSVIAQVLLAPGAAAHSRGARWLAMAWLAALLRAAAQHTDPADTLQETRK